MFDQYGTVVDMQTRLTEAVGRFLAAKGWEGSAHRIVTWWRRTHFEHSIIDALCARGQYLHERILAGHIRVPPPEELTRA